MGKVRKVHLLLLAPDLESVEKINTKLAGVGNLRSDGRPILGMDVRLFLKMIADTCPRCAVIPSHIWTPWFSLFGANSGFDAIEECFEEMTPFIFALETGLSSDPPMNRRLSALDRYALVSNSDAHSPSKIGREANVFDTDFSYAGLIDALRSKDPSKFLHTVEFFPEEGKYHYDGHRKCGVVFTPGESLAHNDICPKCGKRLTIGVMHRVEELADRSSDVEAPFRIPVPEPHPPQRDRRRGPGENARTARASGTSAFRFIREFGDEHKVLTEVPIADLCRLAPERVGEGVDRMRKGRVQIVPGHDGEYGCVRLFDDGPDAAEDGPQMSLF